MLLQLGNTTYSVTNQGLLTNLTNQLIGQQYGYSGLPEHSDLGHHPQELLPSVMASWPRQPPVGYQLTDPFCSNGTCGPPPTFPFLEHGPLIPGLLGLFLLSLYACLFIVCCHCCPGPRAFHQITLMPLWPWLHKRLWKHSLVPQPTYALPLQQTVCRDVQPLLSSNPVRPSHRSQGDRGPTLTLPAPSAVGLAAPRRLVSTLQTEATGDNQVRVATIPLKVQGQAVRALLDTGASICLMTQLLARELELPIIEESTLQVVSVSGHSFPLLGIVKPTVQVGAKVIQDHPIHLVADSPHPVLLGLDLLTKLGPLLMDFQQGKLCLYKHQPRPTTDMVQLGADVDILREWPVTLGETIRVPPRVQMVIPCPCPHMPSQMDVVMEPMDKVASQTGVAVARVLTQVKEGQVPVRLLNPQLEPVMLYKGMTMGHVRCLPI